MVTLARLNSLERQVARISDMRGQDDLAQRHIDFVLAIDKLHADGASQFSEFDFITKTREQLLEEFRQYQLSSEFFAPHPHIRRSLSKTIAGTENYSLSEHWRRINTRSLKPYGVYFSNAREKFVAASRRSFKTVIVTRCVIRDAIKFGKPGIYFPLCATTYSQARRIFWDRLKQYTPKEFIRGTPRETDMEIHLKNGAILIVVGMDKPTRIEGVDVGTYALDEYADQRPNCYSSTIRPCLINTRGGGFRLGKPRGRNHWYDEFTAARDNGDPNKEAFHWTGWEVLDPDEIAAMAEDVDELTMRQEIGAEFISFEGLAYYNFDREFNLDPSIEYNPSLDLEACFDFNTAPGVCQVKQHWDEDDTTRSIGEVHIPRNSTTPKVARRFVENWKHHKGIVNLHGDATGGAQGSAKTEGSDWELIDQILRPVFGTRLRNKVPRSNPPERSRVNATNCRLLNTRGDRRWLINPRLCPELVKDVEGTTVVEGGSGEIDKKSDKTRTHHTDASGYFFVSRFPVEGTNRVKVEPWI